MFFLRKENTYFMVWQGKIASPIANCIERQGGRGTIRVRISYYLQRRKGIERGEEEVPRLTASTC